MDHHSLGTWVLHAIIIAQGVVAVLMIRKLLQNGKSKGGG